MKKKILYVLGGVAIIGVTTLALLYSNPKLFKGEVGIPGKPQLSNLQVSPNPFNVAATGAKMTFSVNITGTTEFSAVNMTVSHDATTVATFSQKDLADGPITQTWDGIDINTQAKVAPGDYVVKVDATDSDNPADSQQTSFKIEANAAATISNIVIDPATFDLKGGAAKAKFSADAKGLIPDNAPYDINFYILKNANDPLDQAIAAFGPQGVKTDGTYSYEWDGLDVAKKLVPPGSYVVRPRLIATLGGAVVAPDVQLEITDSGAPLQGSAKVSNIKMDHTPFNIDTDTSGLDFTMDLTGATPSTTITLHFKKDGKDVSTFSQKNLVDGPITQKWFGYNDIYKGTIIPGDYVLVVETSDNDKIVDTQNFSFKAVGSEITNLTVDSPVFNLAANKPLNINVDVTAADNTSDVFTEIVHYVNGKLTNVKSFTNKNQANGTLTIPWDGKDENGVKVSPGDYQIAAMTGYSRKDLTFQVVKINDVQCDPNAATKVSNIGISPNPYTVDAPDAQATFTMNLCAATTTTKIQMHLQKNGKDVNSFSQDKVATGLIAQKWNGGYTHPIGSIVNPGDYVLVVETSNDGKVVDTQNFPFKVLGSTLSNFKVDKDTLDLSKGTPVTFSVDASADDGTSNIGILINRYEDGKPGPVFIKSFTKKDQPNGTWSVSWDGKDKDGKTVIASNNYSYSVQVGVLFSDIDQFKGFGNSINLKVVGQSKADEIVDLGKNLPPIDEKKDQQQDDQDQLQDDKNQQQEEQNLDNQDNAQQDNQDQGDQNLDNQDNQNPGYDIQFNQSDENNDEAAQEPTPEEALEPTPAPEDESLTPTPEPAVTDNGESACAGFGDVTATDRSLCSAVTFAKDAGIFTGVTADQFAPAEYFQRDQAAKVFATVFGAFSPNINYCGDTAKPLLDIDESSWAYQYICYNKTNRIVTGYLSGPFKDNYLPDRPLTRAEFITLLGRNANKYTHETIPLDGSSTYMDISKTDYFYRYAAWAYKYGLVEGNKFNGNEFVTRAEAAKIFQRLATLGKLKVSGEANINQ